MSETLAIPSGAVDVLARETRSYGVRLLETGGFLFTETDHTTQRGVALAGTRGIVRRRRLFQISARALDRLFTFADDRGLWIPVQFHSHEMSAVMSETDDAHGLRAEGFVSAIIPSFAAPPADVSRWGWWQFQHGGWHQRAPITVHPAAVDLVVTFDEDGVRES